MGALQVSSAYLRSEAHRGHHAKLPIDCVWDGAYKIKHQCTSEGIIRDPSAVIDDGPNNGALLGSLPPPPVTVCLSCGPSSRDCRCCCGYHLPF